MSYEFWKNIPPFTMSAPWGVVRNPIWRRCDAIEKQLFKHDIKAKVSKHHLDDWQVYVIEVDISESHVDEKDVAKALYVPKKMVKFIHIDINPSNKYSIFWIGEDELHDLYLDGEELVFEKEWSFYNKYGCRKSISKIQQRLRDFDNNSSVVSDEKNLLFLFNTSWDNERIAEILGINKDAVTDVSCSHLMDGNHKLKMIIDLDKVKESC